VSIQDIHYGEFQAYFGEVESGTKLAAFCTVFPKSLPNIRKCIEGSGLTIIEEESSNKGQVGIYIYRLSIALPLINLIESIADCPEMEVEMHILRGMLFGYPYERIQAWVDERYDTNSLKG
jgi:hypothetical protein